MGWGIWLIFQKRRFNFLNMGCFGGIMNKTLQQIVIYGLLISLALFISVLILFIGVHYVSFVRSVIFLLMFISFWIGGALSMNIRNVINTNKNTWLYFEFDNLMLLFWNPYADDLEISHKILQLRVNTIVFFGLLLLFLGLA